MKHIKEIARWFVGDIINWDDDFDTLELEMMEDMYLSCIDLDNSKGKDHKFNSDTSARVC